ncbi:glycosyltransferase 87 family protein [Microbacterium hominis]|uniref:DUF2029 domain-containing protein n=1 Tax=Microbacterium hominis TaxID=162426 RepID=A0A7D4THB5_9MICO|nr:glycosyltransferase 87 family protein [Microbacterium hominis]QKJ19961.1 DUF2029 domain-containing protein [Microbacterium hominis]
MSRRAALWGAFALVHVALIALGFADAKAASWDVDQLYRWWADQVVFGIEVPGVTIGWVYPAFALLPMLLARGVMVLVGDYTLAWGLLVTAADAAVFAMLVGDARSRGRVRAAWFWLAAALALGGVGMFRLDALTVPLAIAGLLWVFGRPWLAAALLAAATWLKVWPAALLAAALIAVRRRLAIVGGAAVVTAAVGLAVVLLGGARNVFSFVGDQAARGLQVEAPVSTGYLWLAMLGDPGAWVYYDADMVTFQITGPFIDPVIAAMTPVLAVGMGAITAVGAAKAWRRASAARLLPPLALALVLGFIVLNKVGSPQYLAWLIPPLVLALVLDRRRWRMPAVLALATLLLTQLLFPWLYDALLVVNPALVILITVRNLLLVALFAWAIVRLVRVPVRPRRVAAPVEP